jgi:hypothetical protein
MKNEDRPQYTKEDLMWEAVRRNEDYREYFRCALALRKKSGSKEEIPEYHGFHHFPLDPQYKMYRVFNPDIDIQKIKGLIENGSRPEDVHPYYYLTRVEKDPPVTHHPVPHNLFDDFIKLNETKKKSKRGGHKGDPLANVKRLENAFRTHERNNDQLTINRSAFANKIVLSFYPLAKAEVIIAQVLLLRGKVLKGRDKNYEACIKTNKTLRGKREKAVKARVGIPIDFTCYPRDIEDYIQWLGSYDNIIKHARHQGYNLLRNAGVLEVSDKRFGYSQMVPSDRVHESKENIAKKWRIAYQKAVQLIRVAPDIPFRSSRTLKPLKTRKSSKTRQ